MTGYVVVVRDLTLSPSCLVVTGVWREQVLPGGRAGRATALQLWARGVGRGRVWRGKREGKAGRWVWWGRRVPGEEVVRQASREGRGQST